MVQLVDSQETTAWLSDVEATIYWRFLSLTSCARALSGPLCEYFSRACARLLVHSLLLARSHARDCALLARVLALCRSTLARSVCCCCALLSRRVLGGLPVYLVTFTDQWQCYDRSAALTNLSTRGLIQDDVMGGRIFYLLCRAVHVTPCA